MKKMILLCSALGFAAVTYGVERFVDLNRPDDSAGDGSGVTEATAFRTINAAIKRCNSGDIVTVLPGVYDGRTQGDCVYDLDCSNRVWIGKSITLRSRDGAANTTIVGSPADTESGLGDGAVRCIGVWASCTVSGFTLSNGATHATGAVNGTYGGGISIGSGTVKVLDCVFSNCLAARGGAAKGGTFVRCRFIGNKAVTTGAALWAGSGAFDCLFTGNGAANDPGVSPNLAVVAETPMLVNCSVVDNTVNGIYVVAAGAVYANNIVLYNPSVGGSLNASLWKNSVVTEGSSIITSGTNCKGPGAEDFYSLGTGDYHPLVTGVLADAGDLAAVQDNFGDYVNGKDLDGHDFVTDGKVSIGAFQGKKTADEPCLVLDGGYLSYGNVTLNGRVLPVAKTTCRGLVPGEILQLGYVPASGRGLIAFERSGAETGVDWPTMDDAVYMRAPSAGTVTATLQSGPVKYVDDDADESVQDGSAAHPYATIAAAAQAQATAYSSWVIRVKDGTYDKGEMFDCGLTNRFVTTPNVWTRVVSENGPESATIVGAADTADPENGLGDAAVRCVALGDKTQLQGFTLTGGRTSTSSVGANKCCGGALYAFTSSGTNPTLGYAVATDCVITDCTGERGAAVYNGAIMRCRVTNCKATNNGVLRACTVYASLIDGNVDPLDKGVIGYYVSLYQCTLADNCGGASPFKFANDDSVAAGCVVDGRVAGAATNMLRHTVIRTSNVEAIPDTRIGDPLFVDAASDDYRVLAASPAAHFVPAARQACFLDLTGRPYSADAEGLHTAGAYAEKLACVQVVSDVLADDLEPSGSTACPVTLTATKRSERHLLGFLVDGVFTADDGSGRITIDSIPPDASGDVRSVVVKTVYDTNWYADANLGDDEDNTGFTADSPKKTLAAAAAKMLAGDTLHVAAGTYDAGTMLQTSTTGPWGGYTPAVPSRLVLPEGCTAIAEEGPEKTIIVGQAHDDWPGLGKNAIRCVFLYPNTHLVGFTVTGGATSNGAETMNTCGGGIVALADASFNADSSVVENCIISNNASYRGGGARFGTYRRCKFLDNHWAQQQGRYPAACNATAEHCLFVGNIGTVTATDMRYYNCTFGAGNTVGVGGAAAAIEDGNYGQDDGTAVNTLFAAGALKGDSFVNCAFGTDVTITSIAGEPRTADDFTACVSGDVKLDAASTPQYGSVALDVGNLALVRPDDDADHDLAGGQRVYNGAMDAGCYEFDWRPRYAKDLKARGLAVTAASPETVETAEGVLVRNGRLTADWICGNGTQAIPHSIDCTVTGTGTLTVLLNGASFATLTEADGKQTLRFENEQVRNALVFDYAPGTADGGGALLANGKNLVGMMVILR